MFVPHIISLIVSLFGFLFILSVLVIIHEAGHFFTARRFGIRVEEFGFGFPPRVWKRVKNGTVYSINALPLGGFVKLFGEDPAGGGKLSLKSERSSKNIGKAFFARPVWQRAVVIFAGVVMNALLAFVIYYVFLFASGFKTDLPLISPNHKFYFVNTKINNSVYIGEVVKNSPAGKAGIEPYSKVLSLNGAPVDNSDDFVASVNADKGKAISLVWQNPKNKIERGTLIPRVKPPKGQGPLGIALASASGVHLSYDTPAQKLFSGISHPVNLLLYTLDGTKILISNSVKEKSVKTLGENLSGPIGIFVVVGDVVSQSSGPKDLFLQALNLAGLISISLAFFNVLPIPALDGGRLFFILVEAVTRKRVSARLEAAVNTVGFMVLISILLLVTIFFDFPKLISFLQFLFKG